MTWHAKYCPELGIVETCYEGRISKDELQAAARHTLQLGQQHETNWFLGDCTNLQGGHSIIDLYGLVELLAAHEVSPRFREAILLPGLQASVRDVEFWETACWNRGITVRLFDQREAALKWLINEK